MGFFDSEQSTKSSQQTDPYEVSKGYMDESISRLGNLGTPDYYSGNLTAGLSPDFQNQLNQMMNWGSTGMGGQTMDQLYGQGSNLMGGYDQARDYQRQMMESGPRQLQFNRGAYDQTMSNLMPTIQGDYNRGMRDVNRQLTENTLPGISMAGIGAGDMYGTDTASANQSEIAKRGVADRGADLYSGLYSNAANTANQAGWNAGQAELNQGNMFDANNMQNLMGFGNTGAGMLGNAFNVGQQGFNTAMTAGQLQNQYNQGAIDRDVQRHQYNQESPWMYEQQRLASLLNPSQAFGRTSGQSTTTKKPSDFQNLNSTIQFGADIGKLFAPVPTPGA